MKPLYILASCFLVACGASKKTTAPAAAPVALTAEQHVARGAVKYPGYSLAEYNDGKNLYEGQCQTCHGLYDPRSESEAAWAQIVPNMSKMANRKAGKEVLNTAQQDLILKYVVTMSTAPKS